MRACTYVYVCVYKCECLCTRVFVCMCMCVCVRVCVCVSEGMGTKSCDPHLGKRVFASLAKGPGSATGGGVDPLDPGRSCLPIVSLFLRLAVKATSHGGWVQHFQRHTPPLRQ